MEDSKAVEDSKNAAFDWSKAGSRFSVKWLLKYPSGAKPTLSDIKASPFS